MRRLTPFFQNVEFLTSDVWMYIILAPSDARIGHINLTVIKGRNIDRDSQLSKLSTVDKREFCIRQTKSS